MYNLPHFKEKNNELIIEFMKQHPFAMLIGCANDLPAATQVPLLLEERDGKIILIGHIMRKQDHQLAFEKNPQVLAVFTGPHTYVSATLYTNPQEASTWNYMSVHARGLLKFLDEKGLENALRLLSLHFENNNLDSPTIFNNLSENYRTKLMKSIIAFEIEVDSVEHVFKLSQNRDKESYRHIIKHLQKQGGEAYNVATQMGKRSSELFEDPI
ncbi:MAG: FMN-binding negative transcriptional regulator [Chitinophagaceae bacterium]